MSENVSGEHYRRLYESQREAIERLHEARRIKDELISVVSHELRTPLTSILGYAQALQRYDDRLPPDQRREHVQRILRQGSRLSRLVENLLQAAANVEADGNAVASLRDVVATTLVDLRNLPESGRVDIECDIDEDAKVRITSRALGLIVSNLLDNAVKFGREGTVVKATGRPARGGTVEFTVSNEGEPVAEDARTRIFDAFTQANASATRDVPGAGLGLYIVRQLTEVNGGSVAIAQDDGRIAFTVALPRVGLREAKEIEARQRDAESPPDPLIDPATKLYSRAAFIRLLGAEDARCARYDRDSSVMVIGVAPRRSEATDVRAAAKALRGVTRTSDIVAFLGGLDFGLVAIEAGSTDALVERIRTAFEAAGLQASFGIASRVASGSLLAAWERADAAAAKAG